MFYKECPICYETFYVNIFPYFNCCKNGKLCCSDCYEKMNRINCPFCLKNVDINNMKQNLKKLELMICIIYFICCYLVLNLVFEKIGDYYKQDKLERFKICLLINSTIPDNIFEEYNSYNLTSCEWIKIKN